MKNGNIRIAFLGDIVGLPGRMMFQKYSKIIKNDYSIDGLIVNGENSATNGRGITSKIVHFFKHNGAQVITSGNHIWAQRDIYGYLAQNTDLLRPDNFPSECPGTGVTTFEANGFTLGVVNLQGRVFMRELVNCPFKAADSLLTYLKSKTHCIIVDFHTETTAEKMGLAYYLDGRVSAVVGTHTHVQTADERILPQGTAYITDVGMAGALNSMIGMQKESILRNLITQMPEKFVVDTKGPFVLSGVVIDIEPQTGKAVAIERIRIIDTELTIDEKDE